MANGKRIRIFKNNLGIENPVFAQILGICSTLAVTNKVANTAVMCAALVFTTTLSNLTVSLLRRRIPGRVRMMVEVLIIATYVIVVDLVLKSWLPEMSRQLGPYVGLIITNCIVMGRTEAFALNNPPLDAMADGFSSGLGYAYVLLGIAIPRELLGMGSILAGTPLGVQLFGPDNIFGSAILEGWTNWAIMVMAPGAFFMLALFIWFMKAVVLPRGTSKGEQSA